MTIIGRLLSFRAKVSHSEGVVKNTAKLLSEAMASWRHIFWSKAARRAGFEFPAQAATRFLNGKEYPNVLKAIKVGREELAHKYAITPEKTAKMLWKISEEAYNKGQFNASVSALRELNELAGLKIKKTENLNITANLDNMSHKDIEGRLKEIFGGDIIDAKYDDV